MNKILRKAVHVRGKTLIFREATIEDAEFILSLRTDKKKGQYLNAVNGNVVDQRNWLAEYEKSENQIYFIIEFKNSPIGTVRIYDARGDSFCWGSWILKDPHPNHVALESALMVYAYATTQLGFSGAHFDVRKGNDKVWQFHERFGAKRVGETKEDYLYQIEPLAIIDALERYKRFLPSPLEVKFP